MPAAFARRLHRTHDLGESRPLRHVTGPAGGQRLAARARIAAGRQEHHGQARVPPVDQLHRLDPRQVGHGDVHHHHVGLELVGRATGGDAAGGLADHLDPIGPRQRAHQGPAEDGVIVDDQDADRHGPSSSGGTGKAGRDRRTAARCAASLIGVISTTPGWRRGHPPDTG